MVDAPTYHLSLGEREAVFMLRIRCLCFYGLNVQNDHIRLSIKAMQKIVFSWTEALNAACLPYF